MSLPMHWQVNFFASRRYTDVWPCCRHYPENLTAEYMINHTRPIRGLAALDVHARDFCANIPDLQVAVVEIFATDSVAVGI